MIWILYYLLIVAGLAGVLALAMKRLVSGKLAGGISRLIYLDEPSRSPPHPPASRFAPDPAFPSLARLDAQVGPAPEGRPDTPSGWASFRWRGIAFGYTLRVVGDLRWAMLAASIPRGVLPLFQARALRGPHPVPALPIVSPYAVGVRPFDDRFALCFPAQGVRSVALPAETWFRLAALDDLCRPPSPALETHESRVLLWFPRDPSETRDPEACFQAACRVLEAMLGGLIRVESDPDVHIIEVTAAPAGAGPLCQVCGDAVEAAPVYCTRCRTAHHRDCWEYHGCCSTFGCGCLTCGEAG